MKYAVIAGFIAAFGAIVSAELPEASQALSAAGIQGGFCVVVGTEDGELEAALTNGGVNLVQGLALSEQVAKDARENLFQKKLYPVASVSYVASAAKLPYTDRIVNLLVADLDALGANGPSMSEINRVVAYSGTAYIKDNGSWKKHYIPVPADVNQYTHWKDDSTLSCYQNDARVGIPNQVKWIGAPDAYFDNQERRGLCIFESERVAGGTWTGTVGGGTWARDAFSGVLLWREDYLGTNFPTVNHQAGNQMWVMTDKYLFGYTGRVEEGLVAYDLRTGEIKKRYWNTVVLRTEVEEDGDIVLNEWDKKHFNIAQTIIHEDNVIQIFGNNVWYMNQESGEIIWHHEVPGDNATIIRNGLIQDSVLAIAVTQFNEAEEGNMFFGPAREYFASFKKAVGLRLSDGEKLWTLDELPEGQKKFHEMIAAGEGKCIIVSTSREPRHCLNMHTGEIEWTIQDAAGYIHGSYRGNAINVPGKNMIVFASHLTYSTHDLSTGQKLGKMSLKDYFGSCPSTTVTPDYIVASEKFVPFIDKNLNDLKADADYQMVTIGTAACSYVPIMAYGQMYQIGGKCSCRRSIPTQNSSQRVNPVFESDVLSREKRVMTSGGVAALLASALDEQTAAQNSRLGEEWTERSIGTYVPRSSDVCADPKSSGKRGAPQFMVSGEHLRHWHRMPVWTGMARKATATVEAGDLSIAAMVHEHRVVAKRNGQQVWNFVADSRISGDPVVDGSRVYFGGHDGYVYALNVSDGSLAWKFLAAPDDLRLVAYSQVESLWPVFGVALSGGNLYAVAGRLATLDGGLQAYCLDASNGNVKWHVQNMSGYTDETVTHNGSDNLKTCTDGADMSQVRGWAIDNAINDIPFVENGMLMVPSWHIDINNPRDTIFFPDNLPGPVGTIRRTTEKTLNNHRITPMIELRNGALFVLGAEGKSYRVGINDARGRCLASYTQEGVYKTDLNLSRLPDGFYVVWVQIEGSKEYAKLKLTTVK